MASSQSFLSRLKPQHFAAGLVIWLLVLLASYLIMTFQLNRRNEDTRQRGITVTQELSDQIRVPLLEKDIPGVQALLRKAHKETDAIYASVSDHGGQIIAYTGAENFVPRTDGGQASSPSDDVAYLEGLLKSHQKVFRFTADVFFSGTRIGEVVMALSALDADRIRSGFQIAALIGVLIFILLFTAVQLVTRAERVNRMETELQAATAADATEERGITTIICPLCGAHKPFAPDVFRRTKFEKLVNVGSSKDTTGLNILADGEGIDLLALSHRKDLSGLKRQVIRRCLEIVRKLSK
ncbi:MAG: hypothetical protein QNI89_10245 [Desulfobacterales bacterium]|nr:hypothetical protein [Desulfobacterales bacterium]MDJ0887674.1 hypothetical protein [Desulfobacterales bacterium]MDJ0990544.1 hypothetical protein [Desulfobacterales bacterium]